MSFTRLIRAIEGSSPDTRPTFWFDVGSPLTYLHAERVDRMLPRLSWRPALEPAGERGLDRAELEREAAERELPLTWPDRFGPAERAARVAALACERGRGAAFAVAASRLAWCGGYDIEDAEVLATAAAAAGIDAGECARAAADASRDRQLASWHERFDVGARAPLPAIEFDGELLAFRAGGRLARVAVVLGPVAPVEPVAEDRGLIVAQPWPAPALAAS